MIIIRKQRVNKKQALDHILMGILTIFHICSESFSTLKAATIESNHISLASESIRLVVAVFYLRCILCEALRTEKKTMEKVSRSMEQTHKMHRKPIYKHLCRMATHKK